MLKLRILDLRRSWLMIGRLLFVGLQNTWLLKLLWDRNRAMGKVLIGGLWVS